jgi:hypothetical protein
MVRGRPTLQRMRLPIVAFNRVNQEVRIRRLGTYPSPGSTAVQKGRQVRRQTVFVAEMAWIVRRRRGN